MAEQVPPRSPLDRRPITEMGEDFEDIFSDHPAGSAPESYQGAIDRQEANKDASIKGDISGDEAEPLQECTAAVAHESPAAPGEIRQPTTAPPLEQPEQQLATPRPTQAPEAESAPLPSVKSPNGAEIEMGNTPNTEEPAKMPVAGISLSNEEFAEKQKTLALEDIGTFVLNALGVTTPPPETPAPVKTESSSADTKSEMLDASDPHNSNVKEEPESKKKKGGNDCPSPRLHGIPRFESGSETQSIVTKSNPEPSWNASSTSLKYPDLKSVKRHAPRQKPTIAITKTNKRKARSPAKKVSPAKKLQKVARGSIEKSRSPPKPKEGGLSILQHIANQTLIPDQIKGVDSKEPAVKEKSIKAKQYRELFKNCPKASDPDANKCDLAALTEAVKFLGARKWTLVKGKWLLNGMNTGLFHYQVLGVAWMCKREKVGGACSGGLLADGMGLGKTVQTVTLMKTNRPDKEQPRKQRATLIVAPVGTIYQWKREIGTHAGKVFTNIIIFTGAKEEANLSKGTLERAQVVITTFGSVIKSYPSPDAENGGLLHQIEWFRIVIDEAHYANNYHTQTSKAISALRGKYRWALSGTPVQNSYDELYPYFRFWHHPQAEDMKTFRTNFLKPECAAKLNKELAQFVFGRTMSDKFMGRSLVILPQAHEHCMKIDLDPAEKILYRAVEKGFREFLNQELDEGDELSNLKLVVVQLTRLRQMTAHPLLIEREAKAILSLKALQDIHSKLQVIESGGGKLYDRIGKWIEEKGSEGSQDALKHLAGDHLTCGLCGDGIESPKITPCKHLFCESCIMEYATSKVACGEVYPPCPTCEAPFEQSQVKDYKVKKSRSSSNDPDSLASARKGKDALNHVPSTQRYSWLDDYDAGNDILTAISSTKMRAVEGQIRAWQLEAPDDKIIVFTQWLPFATIIGRVLERLQIKFVYLTGDMSIQTRDKAIAEFQTNTEVNIMVATLKTAGIGLNLTHANRVISLDPWWNASVERQAFARVLRIGQLKETHFVRIIVNDSVDARMIKMQEKKLKALGDVMQSKMTAEGMAAFFGQVVQDGEGGWRVEADYDYNIDVDDMGDDEASEDSDKSYESDSSEDGYRSED
ncbi:uncharacterized protein PAC_01703 [Phialocephala subalpina]|uniref:Uncharacterized protein n=1 Tax=Phialocephala subalpina TaxID=576137 RepID=A0A1L7WGD7_9HELO|nr:uncharacterized protein PAC_01703 [Phialocephala subalpina]